MDKQRVIALLNGNQNIPMLSRSLSEVFFLLSSPNTLQLSEVADEIVKVDQMKEMLLANLSSSFFPFSPEKKSLRDLLVFLGLQNISVLLIALITKQLLPNHLGRAQEFERTKYWKHSIGTAVGAKMLAERTGLSEKYKVFAYGLIHDIGVAVMDICLPDLLDEVCNIQRKGVHQIIAEKIVMGGMTHEDIGGWLCSKWKLPLDIQALVTYHHRPLLAPKCVIEAKTLHLADNMSTEYYENLIGIKLPMNTNRTVMGDLNITDVDMDTIRKNLPGEIEKTNKVLVFK